MVYTSDNGCGPIADFYELKKKGHNPSYIFRGAKADIYEGGHRIPFIVQWPDKIRAGIVSHAVICLSDFMATMADCLGITRKADEGEDSISNLPLWTESQKEVRRSYPRPGEETDDAPRFQLYDLEADIGATTNVILEYPEVATELKRILIGYILNGRSTPGPKQKNNGREIWDAIFWIRED